MKKDLKYSLLGIILLITLVSYWPVLQNGFVWDDEGYIVNNPLVKSLHLKAIFTQNVMGNYHPVTVLLLAIEYYFFGLNASAFHVVNLFFHLINVLLVYVVAKQLTGRINISLVAALLFGIHPMLSESVAWISGLKDLLCTSFFLSAFICYIRYLKTNRRVFILITFLFFLLSVLSKATAVSLPVVLILTDFYLGRKLNSSAWLEKVPFFLLSLISGMIAIKAQETTGNLSLNEFNLLQRISFACYGFIIYLVKFILPIKLSAFYPYPSISREDFQAVFYLFPFLFLLISGLILFSLRKTKNILFGTGFFLITIFLVLQWLPVGKAIMADRYTYLPSIGIFLLAGIGFHRLYEIIKIRWLAPGLVILFTLFFSFPTFSRTKIWTSDITLWSDVISKYDNVPVAWLNRGIAWAKQDRLNDARQDFDKAVQLDPDYSKAYFNRGNIHLRINLPELALADFTKAVELNPAYAQTWFNRGNLYLDKGLWNLAIADFTRNLQLEPGNSGAYMNRGIAYGRKRDFDSSMADLKRAAALDPDNPDIYFHLGVLSYLKRNYPEAIGNFSKVLQLRSSDAEAWYYRGMSGYYSGKKDQAINDLNKAGSLGYQPAIDFLKALDTSP